MGWKGDSMNTVGWNFDNSYVKLPDTFFTILNPTPVSSPELVILNEPLAISLGLQSDMLKKDDGINVLAGNIVPEGALPLAQAYAGHQFGHLTMLGDGRAHLLGEHVTPDGKRVDIQFKGSGKTPYSRRGDGRAALGPMLREYIISEAMHALGIPTTRSLAVVKTGEQIVREDFLTGAILTRVATSHIRVGTFQYAAGTEGKEGVKALADYTISRHLPSLSSSKNPYLAMLEEAVDRQARLIAKWQHVGFIHGVMNTDNMTIYGETIDYGPCAFMDTYHPKTVFSSIDTHGRYSYENQPKIAGWNLARFAETLLPLLHEDADEAVTMAQEVISSFSHVYESYWLEGMRRKLGILDEEEGDATLIQDLLQLMKEHKADYTNTFVSLMKRQVDETSLFESTAFKDWYARWQKRLSRQNGSEDESQLAMQSANPIVIPRNYQVEKALEAASEHENYSVMNKLLQVLQTPYCESKLHEPYMLAPKPSMLPYRTYCGT